MMNNEKISKIRQESEKVINKFKTTMDESKRDLSQSASDEDIKNAVDKVNPDKNSMESRG